MKIKFLLGFIVCFAVTGCPSVVSAADGGEAAQQIAVAKQLSNPVASLISVPFQVNYDRRIGAKDRGKRVLTNIQPVIPFSLTEAWNLISRTILPFIYQHDVLGNDEEQYGMGDMEQSLFFSPKEPTAGGLIWGAGPIFLLPTASKDTLGKEKWGAGPTAVALKQEGPWTCGMLANHIWSFAGNDDRRNISATYLQPFLSYVTKTRTTFGLNLESTYDWKNEEWSVPVHFTVSQLLKAGKQLFQVGVGVRYWAQSPETGAEGWGARFVLTFLFPEKRK